MNTQNNPGNSQDPRSAAPQSSSHPAQPNTQLYGNNQGNVQTKNSQPELKQSFFKNPRFRGFFGVVQIAVGAIVAALIINTFIFQSYEVVGESMYPTLNNGDRLIINKLGKSWTTLLRDDFVPKRGDIIVFDDPSGSNRQLVKRVIGLPGDTVIVSNGVITITNAENPQGFNPDESYADSLTMDSNYSLSTKVSDDKLFVAGDNRVGGASFDSRNDLGLVDTDLIVGSLILRLLPLSESRFF